MRVGRVAEGPRGDLLTGSLRAFDHDPLGFMTRCARTYGDFVPLRFGHKRAVLLSHPDWIGQVLVAENDKFIKGYSVRLLRRRLGNGLLLSEGPYWQSQRRVLQPTLREGRAAEHLSAMGEAVAAMLEGWSDGEVRDVHAELLRLTTRIALRVIFGLDLDALPETDRGALWSMVAAASARRANRLPFADRIPNAYNRRAERIIRELDRFIYGQIALRRAGADPGDDILGELLEATRDDGSRLGDRELRDELMTLLFTAHDTTAIALSWSFHLLSRDPEAEERLVGELREQLGGRTPGPTDLRQLRYTEGVVNEALRLFPPGWAMSREALADCQVGGRTIRAGTTVVMSQWVVHRDPRYFDRPETFDPDRWSDGLAKRLPRFAFFPFGAGPRRCAGAGFAMIETVALLAAIAQRYSLRAVAGHVVVPNPVITLHPRDGLPMALRRR